MYQTLIYRILVQIKHFISNGAQLVVEIFLGGEGKGPKDFDYLV
jgi:hypothetical protein